MTKEEKYILNWTRFTSKASLAIKHNINAADEAVRAKLVEKRTLTADQVKADVVANQQILRDMGIDPLSDEQIHSLDMSGELRVITERQNYVRGLLSDYSEMAAELFEKADGFEATPSDIIAFELVSRQADTLSIIVKQNQEKISAALGHQRIVPDRMATNTEMMENLHIIKDPQAMEKYVTDLGQGNRDLGLHIMRSRRKRYKAAVEANNGNKVAGTKFLTDNPTITQKSIEYWMNSILSGPITHAVNATSNSINTFALVGEKMAGGLLTLDSKEFKNGVSMFGYLFEQAKDAFKAAAIAFKSEEDILDPLYRTIEYGTNVKEATPSRALRSDNPILDYVGQALNLPTRLLLSSDVFFRTMNYRAMVKAKLWGKRSKMASELDGLKSSSLALLITENFIPTRIFIIKRAD